MNQNNQVVTKQKVMMPITSYTFESILNYLLLPKTTNARYVRNIIKLMDSLDTKAYEKDDYLITVITVIIFVAQLRYDGVSNPTYIKNTLLQGAFNQKHITHIYKTFEMLERNEYEHLGKTVRDYVDYMYLFQSRNDILMAYDELMNTNGKMAVGAIEQLKNTLEDLLSVMRRADVTRNEDESVSISAKPTKELRLELNKLYDELTDPRNIFKTGLKELNRFLNGGARRKGMIVICGPTNSFKSGVLLYFALWIIQFNPGLKAKIPSKKLAVVIVTMENTRDEELERIHAIYTQGMVNVQDISKDVWVEQWEQIFPSLGTEIELHILYRSPIDTTTIDIQASIEELEEDNNLEVMAVIIDHLGNIKARNRQGNTNEWRDTVQITYELSDWAKSSNRALITAMHTNSQLDERIAEAIQSGKTNLIKMLGRHCIADAKYIERAVDITLYILREFNNIDGHWYLGMKFEKQRGKRDRGSNMFYHRLENDITLQYDEGTPVCKSFPCLPGTENTIQTQQMAAATGRQGPIPQPVFGQNPFQNGFTNPFGEKTPAYTPPQPVLNEHPDIDYDISKEMQDIPSVSEDPIEEINGTDFKNDSEEFDKMINIDPDTYNPTTPPTPYSIEEIEETDFSSEVDEYITSSIPDTGTPPEKGEEVL